MAIRQIVKYKRKTVSEKIEKREQSLSTPVPAKKAESVKNNQKKNKEAMDEKVNKAEEIMNNMKSANHVKVVKKDKGLIERTESSKIVLTEDNRQVLND